MPTTEALAHPPVAAALRRLRFLSIGYLVLGVAVLAAIVALRNHTDLVTQAVWVRGAIVVASALLMLTFVARTAQGHHGAYRRLRLVSAILVIAIVVILIQPGTFPLWMKIAQGVIGLDLLALAIIANTGPLPAVFSSRGE